MFTYSMRCAVTVTEMVSSYAEHEVVSVYAGVVCSVETAEGYATCD